MTCPKASPYFSSLPYLALECWHGGEGMVLSCEEVFEQHLFSPLLHHCTQVPIW